MKKDFNIVSLQEKTLLRRAQTYGADRRRWPAGARAPDTDGPLSSVAEETLRNEAELDNVLNGALDGAHGEPSSPNAHGALRARVLADFDAVQNGTLARAAPRTFWRMSGVIAAGFALGLWGGVTFTDNVAWPLDSGPYVAFKLKSALNDGIAALAP